MRCGFMRAITSVAVAAMCVGLGACGAPVPLDEPKGEVAVEDSREPAKEDRTRDETPDAQTEKPAQAEKDALGIGKMRACVLSPYGQDVPRDMDGG